MIILLSLTYCWCERTWISSELCTYRSICVLFICTNKSYFLFDFLFICFRFHCFYLYNHWKNRITFQDKYCTNCVFGNVVNVFVRYLERCFQYKGSSKMGTLAENILHFCSMQIKQTFNNTTKNDFFWPPKKW